MKSLDFYRERIFNGLFIILCFTGCFALLIIVFLTTAEDKNKCIDEIYSRLSRTNGAESEVYIPKVNKWDFEIMLPIEGASTAYHWKVKGAFSTNKNKREQCIYVFSGETMDEKNPVKLVSPEMVFIDDEKELYTRKSFFAKMGWGSVNGSDMVLRLDTDTVEVRKGVEVALEVAALPEGAAGIVGETDAENAGNATASASESEKTEKGKEGESSEQLVITSDKLKILGKEEKAIFTGKVVGRDKDGTISADVMEVQNYTKEEKKADPRKNGVKTVECKGHVKIDLTDQAAKCHHAIFNAANNTVTLLGTTIDDKLVQVEYWTKDGQQILCDKMIINRETKEVEFLGNQKSTDYNPSKSSFLDFGIDEGKDEKQNKETPDSTTSQKEGKTK
jgi:lipopolysaccharide export system protein LptA